MVLIFMAGLRALPTEPYEAAMIDGASAWQTLAIASWKESLGFSDTRTRTGEKSVADHITEMKNVARTVFSI